jgi:hypothetical protein
MPLLVALSDRRGANSAYPSGARRVESFTATSHLSEHRHELSRELPKFVQLMLTQHTIVQETGVDNVMRVDFQTPIVAGSAAMEYYTFFRISKQSPPEAPKFIKMYVESAYPESVMYDKPASGKGTAFAELLGDCWEGRYPRQRRRK